VTGLKLADGAQQGGLARHVFPGEELGQGVDVQVTLHQATGQQALDLRSPDQIGRREHVVEGLDAHVIARQKQLAAAGVVDREGEHAVEKFRTAAPVLLIGVDDDLGIALGAKAVAARFQIAAQRLEVIDFAVLDRQDGAVLVEDRLVAAVHVDDRQAPHAQPDAAPDVDSLVVRPPVRQARAHGFQLSLGRWTPVGEGRDTRDTAHAQAIRASKWRILAT